MILLQEMFKRYPQNLCFFIRGACFYHEKVRTLDYKGVRTGILCGFEFYRTAIIYFLSRPRRFGKSLLVSTLKAYFQGKKELFKGLAIDALEKEWAEYPVFHIDFNGTNFTQGDALSKKIEGYIASWEREYGNDPVRMTSGDRFAYVLKQAHKKYGRRPASVVSHRSEFFFRNRYCK